MNSDDTVDREESLDDILAAYWIADEAGVPLDRQALMARHPQYAAELAEFFADLDGIEQDVQPLRAIREPAAATLPNPPATTPASRFTILQPHAEGGLGRVHLARDEQLRRTVALKEIRPERADDPRLRQRFLAEAEITGQLEHPGIVPIYALEHDAAGRPVYAMRFIQGRTLADSIKAYRQQPTTLGLSKLLQRFIAISQTMAYAHSKDVIHRDLKPANVMIGDYGETLVVDWGLAKRVGQKSDAEASEREAPTALTAPAEGTSDATVNYAGAKEDTDDEHRTEEGQVLGTPAFMPPEQARGEIKALSPAADIYALGAILYTILTGHPPYRGESAMAILKQVLAGPPPAPAQRVPGVPRALNAICLKAMARDANARYPTATDLASDVERWLADAPVMAYREPLRDRVARWSRRHRTLVTGVAAAFLVGFVSLTIGYVWYDEQQGEAKRKQLRADAEAATKKALASREFNDAVNKVTALRERAKTATVGGAALFAQAREQTQRALALAENGPADEAMKEQVRNLIAELDEEEKDRLLLAAIDEAYLASAESTEDRTRYSSGLAVPKFRDALRAYGLPAGEGEPASVAARIRLRPAGVREILVMALDHWIDLAANPLVAIPEPHRDWLLALISAAEPDDGWTRRFRAAREEQDLAKRRAALQKLAEEPGVGKLPAQSLIRLAERLLSVEAGVSANAVRLLRRAQEQYPADFWVNHYLGRALRHATPPELEHAVRFLTAAAALRPESPLPYVDLGVALDDRGQVDEAIVAFKKAVALDPKVAVAHNNLGNVLVRKGQSKEAIVSYQRAIDLDPKFAMAHFNLGVVLAREGQVDEAFACYEKTIAFAPRNAIFHNNLGIVLSDTGHVNEAIACFKEATALDPKFAAAGHNLRVALCRLEKLDEARTFFQQAYADPSAAQAFLANFLRRARRMDEAVAAAREAVQLNSRSDWAQQNLAWALLGQGNWDGAIAAYRQAILLKPDNPTTRAELGDSLKEKGLLGEAIAEYRKAIDLDAGYVKAHDGLGIALAGTGQVDEAIVYFKKAIALDPQHAPFHCNLGHALKMKNLLDEAIAEYRQAIDLQPEYAEAHCNMAFAFRLKGQLSASLDSYERGHTLGSKLKDWRYPSAQWVTAAERLVRLEAKLLDVLAGKAPPTDNRERLGLAEVCQLLRRHADAARFSTTALAADAKLADDLQAGHRYNAARSASLAAAGMGEDATKLDDKERAMLRKQSLDWLRADLAAYTKLLNTRSPPARASVERQMRHWQEDTDLASVRGAKSIAKLPETERAGWEKLWQEVEELRDRAAKRK